MGSDEVAALVEQALSVDVASADRDTVHAALGAVRRLKSWVEGREAVLAHRLAEVVSYPERHLAAAGHTSQHEAAKVLRRAATAREVPRLGAALAAGALTGAHLDAVERVLRRVDGAQRVELAARADLLVESAQHAPPGDLEKALRAEARALAGDGGANRHEQQQAAARVRTFVDDDGMWRVTACLD